MPIRQLLWVSVLIAWALPTGAATVIESRDMRDNLKTIYLTDNYARIEQGQKSDIFMLIDFDAQKRYLVNAKVKEYIDITQPPQPPNQSNQSSSGSQPTDYQGQGRYPPPGYQGQPHYPPRGGYQEQRGYQGQHQYQGYPPPHYQGQDGQRPHYPPRGYQGQNNSYQGYPPPHGQNGQYQGYPPHYQQQEGRRSYPDQRGQNGQNQDQANQPKEVKVELKKVGAGDKIADYETTLYKVMANNRGCSHDYFSQAVIDSLPNFKKLKEFFTHSQQQAQKPNKNARLPRIHPCALAHRQLADQAAELGMPMKSVTLNKQGGEDMVINEVTAIKTDVEVAEDYFSLDGYQLLTQEQLQQQQQRPSHPQQGQQHYPPPRGQYGHPSENAPRYQQHRMPPPNYYRE